MKHLVLSASLVLTPPVAQAVNIVLYDFEGDSYNNKASATGIVSTPLSKGTAFDLDDGFSNDATQGSRSIFSRGVGVQQTSGSTGVAFPQALSDGNYVEFTITASAGYTFSLNSFLFDTAWQASTNHGRLGVTSNISAHDYTSREDITTELANDAASIADVLQSNLGGFPKTAVDAWGQGENTAIDVTGAEFQNITSVTFRIVGHAISNPDPADDSNIFRLDDIRIDADVTLIPEPSAAIFGLLGIFGFALRRRR